jgi:hypothetical protein
LASEDLDSGENDFGIFQDRFRISSGELLMRNIEFVTTNIHVLGITAPPKPIQLRHRPMLVHAASQVALWRFTPP